MVYKRRNARKRKYTPRKKRNYRRRNRRRLPPIGGNPSSKLVRFRYTDQFSLNPGIGAISSWVFRANDLFDPNLSGGGHQPYGFDQQMTYYDHFKVIGSRITIRPVSWYTSADGGIMGCLLSDDGVSAVGAGNINHLLESRQTGMNIKYVGTMDYNQQQKSNIIRKSFSHKKFFRQPMTDKFQGSATASPAEKAYFEVFVAAATATADPPALAFIVTIDYIAVLTEPKNIAQS